MGEIIATAFEYANMTPETVSFLKQRESAILEIVSKTGVDMGKELSEAQEHLSKNGYGCFEDWYISLGLKKQSVYNYINYYRMIVQRVDKRDLIESLPKPLVYEIAKPTAPSDLKEKVLSGDIITTKEYKELVKAQKEAERKAEEAERKAREAQVEVQRLNSQLSKQPKVIEKEVIPESLLHEKDKLKAENERLKLNLEEAQEKANKEPLVIEKEVIPEDYGKLKEKVARQTEELNQLTLAQMKLKNTHKLRSSITFFVNEIGKRSKEIMLEYQTPALRNDEANQDIESCAVILEKTARELRDLIHAEVVDVVEYR